MDPASSPTSPSIPSIPDIHPGRINYDNGDVYIGEILNGLRHGEGSLVSDKRVFQGSFRNDVPFHGKLTIGDSYYKGDVVMKDGMIIRHGKGYMKYHPLTWYDGDWVNDQRHGHGLYCEYRGKYEGAWDHDRIALQHVTDLLIQEAVKGRIQP